MTSLHRRGITRFSLIAGGLLWTAVFASLILVLQDRGGAPQATAAGQAGTSSDDPVRPGENKASVKLSFPARQLPDFEFQKVTGGTLGLGDLKGKRWVASFVFSRCTTSCPMISRAVMKVHDRVKDSAPDVHFVSVTVDPKYDTAEVFREYSETFTQGDASRWSFLTGSQQEIYELVVNGFGLYVKENLGKARMPGFEVAHTNRVVLVNEDGFPVGTFLGTREEDMVKLSRILADREPFPEPGPALTFSTSDGSPLQLEFEVTPAEEPDGREEDVAPTESANSDVGGPDIPDTTPATSGDDGTTDSQTSSAAEHNAAIDLRLPGWARKLPKVNAGLNSLAAVLLLIGFSAIKAKRRDLHRNLMITAFLTSVVFLACYLTYHYALGKYTGEHGRKFTGDGLAATVYQLILWPHIVLAVFVPILAIRVFQHAFAERWDAHRKLARVTFPIWMFVSVTGVVIYGMLYHW